MSTFPLSDVVIQVDESRSNLEDTLTLDVESIKNKEIENAQEQSIIESSRRVPISSSEESSKRKSSKRNVIRRNPSIIRANYFNNVNEIKKKKIINLQIRAPSRKCTINEGRNGRNCRNGRYSHLEKYSKISRNLNRFTLPKISNSIHIKYTHDSINLNNTINKSSCVQNEKYTLTVPFELANFKNPHHDQNESCSYEMPSSTPEFIESPLTSGNSQKINQRESFNIAPSGLSTFKRIAESSPNIGNESSLDCNNEESKYLNQQPTSKFQEPREQTGTLIKKTTLSPTKTWQLSGQITFCQHPSPESKIAQQNNKDLLDNSLELIDASDSKLQKKNKIIQLKKVEKSRNSTNEEMKVNFKTYQIALKSMQSLKQQADEFKNQNNKLKKCAQQVLKYT